MTLKSLNYPQEENGGIIIRETWDIPKKTMYCLVEKGSQESIGVIFDEVFFSILWWIYDIWYDWLYITGKYEYAVYI